MRFKGAVSFIYIIDNKVVFCKIFRSSLALLANNVLFVIDFVVFVAALIIVVQAPTLPTLLSATYIKVDLILKILKRLEPFPLFTFNKKNKK